MIIIIIIHLYSHIAHPRSFILLWKRVSFLCSYTYSFSLFRKCSFVQRTIRHSFQQQKNSIDIWLYRLNAWWTLGNEIGRCCCWFIFSANIISLGNIKFCSLRIIASRCASKYFHSTCILFSSCFMFIFTLFYQKHNKNFKQRGKKLDEREKEKQNI